MFNECVYLALQFVFSWAQMKNKVKNLCVYIMKSYSSSRNREERFVFKKRRIPIEFKFKFKFGFGWSWSKSNWIDAISK